VVDPDGDNSTINSKRYGKFRTLDGMVGILSATPPPSKWPCPLSAGLAPGSAELVAIGTKLVT